MYIYVYIVINGTTVFHFVISSNTYNMCVLLLAASSSRAAAILAVCYSSSFRAAARWLPYVLVSNFSVCDFVDGVFVTLWMEWWLPLLVHVHL
jgi:hypothetical protein